MTPRINCQSQPKQTLGSVYEEVLSKFAKEEMPKSYSKLPDLSTPMKPRITGLYALGLGGGATSPSVEFKEKEQDEWHKLIQMEVALEYEDQLKKKRERIELNKKFRKDLDEQISERKKKKVKEIEQEVEFMLK